MTNREHIYDLFGKWINLQTTEAETEQLMELIRTADLKKELLPLMDTIWAVESSEDIPIGVTGKAISDRILNNTSNDLSITPVHRVHFLKTAWFRVAVVVIFCLGIGAYLWLTPSTPNQEITQSKPVSEKNDVLPGGNKAILKLSDGSEITLDSASKGKLAEQSGASIEKSSDGQIIYTFNKNILSQTVAYNTMSTPRGGQYQLILPDGSKVWLNAESSITFPTAFTGNMREVNITGEVYLAVKPDKQKAFVVNTKEQRIEVLGTEFNVNAYVNENITKTSLIDGAVKINKVILKPGQAYLNGRIIATNIGQDIAWRDGYFNFEGADLPSVMRQLSRWYDVEVKYARKVEQRKFFGKLSRDLTLSQVMEILKDVNIDFEIEGRTLFVK